MQEIVSDILTWSWFSEPHGYDFNGHLIRNPSANICIDPVEPSGDDFDAIVREGAARILLTNRNHSRAANRVRAGTGAKTAIHAGDADHARGQETDIADKIGPLEVIEAAGKSPGEVALFWRERGILIVGDAVIGDPPGRLRLLPERVMDDPARLRRSVVAFLNLDFDTLLVGDGVSLLDGAKARLRELADTFPD